MSMPKLVLWKATDGREFTIDTKELKIETIKALYDHIQMLREKYGYEKSTFSHVAAGPGRTLEQYGIDAVDVSALPEHLRGEVLDTIKENTNKPDPKMLN